MEWKTLVHPCVLVQAPVHPYTDYLMDPCACASVRYLITSKEEEETEHIWELIKHHLTHPCSVKAQRAVISHPRLGEITLEDQATTVSVLFRENKIT